MFSSASDPSDQGSRDTSQRPASPLPATYIPPTLQGVDATVESFTRIGQPLPTLPLQSLDGETFSFDQFTGQLLVVNFWAVWCPPCVREMPVLQEFHETSDDTIAILAVTDPANGQSLAQVLEFLDQNGIDQLPIGLDQHMTLHNQLAIQQLPTTLFVDSNGIIRQEHSGELTTETLHNLVEQLRQTSETVD